jgi:hypothetical protein
MAKNCLDEDSADKLYESIRRKYKTDKQRTEAFMALGKREQNSRFKLVSLRTFDRLSGDNGMFLNDINYHDPIVELPKSSAQKSASLGNRKPMTTAAQLTTA